MVFKCGFSAVYLAAIKFQISKVQEIQLACLKDFNGVVFQFGNLKKPNFFSISLFTTNEFRKGRSFQFSEKNCFRLKIDNKHRRPHCGLHNRYET